MKLKPCLLSIFLAVSAGQALAGEAAGDGKRYTAAVRSFADTVLKRGRALLELARTTNDRSFLKLACRVADNLLQSQSKTGLFPRAGHVFARTGDQIPLAILHLAAALDGKDSSLPPAMLDNAYFHCEYDGAAVPQKPGIEEKRTYDSSVFYGE